MMNMKTAALFPGLIIGQNVVSTVGQLLICRGNRINSKNIQLLKDYGIKEVKVFHPDLSVFPIGDSAWVTTKPVEKIRVDMAFNRELELQGHRVH